MIPTKTQRNAFSDQPGSGMNGTDSQSGGTTSPCGGTGTTGQPLRRLFSSLASSWLLPRMISEWEGREEGDADGLPIGKTGALRSPRVSLAALALPS